MNVMIIGAGEIGAQVAGFLVEQGQDVVVIERNAAKARELSAFVDAAVVVGDGTDPSVLTEAGVQSARLLLSVTDTDAVNILACNIASVLAPDAIRLARIRNDAYARDRRILERNGIQIAINPEQLVVDKIANLLRYRKCIDYVDFENGRVAVVAFPILPASPVAGKTLKAIRARFPTPDYLIAMVNRGGHVIIPDGDVELVASDRVYFILRPADIPELQRILGLPTGPSAGVFIHGGDYLAMNLARKLSARPEYSVKVAHPDPERCDRMASTLDNVLVLNGDPSDVDFLRDECTAENTVFIAAEHDEERNLLSAVLARSSGKGMRVIAVTNRTNYVPVLAAVGLDVVLCPLNVAASNIVQYLVKGAVVQMGPLETRDATVLEFLATERQVGRPIRKLGLPPNVLIGAVLRGEEAMIPTGNTEIAAGDRLIVFAPRSQYSKLDRHFALRTGR